MFQKKKISNAIFAFILFFAASVYITYPLIFHLGDYATGFGDELLIAWIHSWVIHALITNPFTLFNANILYPYHNTLAYSDTFITGSLLTYFFVHIIGQPISANNITLISSITFLGFSVYLLTYYLTKDFIVSLLAGILILFSPASLSYTVHLQVLEVYWVPLSLFFFLLFINYKKTFYLIVTLLCFLLQFYNSFLPAYFILFSIIIILVFLWLEKKKKFLELISKQNILLVLFTFLLLIPIVIPYFQISKEFHYVRDLRDSIHFALQPEDLLFPGDTTRLKNFLLNTIPTNHYSQNNEFKPGYLGFIFTLLFIFSVIYFIRNRKKTMYEKSFITIAATGLLLSFGPFLHLNRHTIHHPFPVPLPYALFYYIMPGFQGFRNSARWEMLFIISIAILIGLELQIITKKISFKIKIAIYLVLIIGIIGEFSQIQFISIPQKKVFPKIYSWMDTTPVNSTFIFMPIYNWNMQPYAQQELFREYYSTIEFRPMVNGYSGFSPPPWQEFISFMHNNFPNDKSIYKLRDMGVRYIVIDKYSFDKGFHSKFEKIDGDTAITILKKDKLVTFIKSFDNYSVFAIGVKK